MKSLLTILIFVFGLTFTSFSQNKPASGDISAKIIKVFPIPATTVVNFDVIRSYDKSYSFVIYNFMGKKMVEIKNIPQRITLPLNEFYRGVYIFQLRDRNGRILESGRFQVVK